MFSPEVNDFLAAFDRHCVEMYGSISVTLPDITILADPHDLSAFVNVATCFAEPEVVDLSAAEAWFTTRGREYSIEVPAGHDGWRQWLEQHGYRETNCITWKAFRGDAPELDASDVQEVTDEQQLAVFLDIFTRSFQTPGPDNPFAEVTTPETIETVRQAWISHHASKKIRYFMGYRDNQPVATSAVTSAAGLGIIANIGTLPDLRRQGFGRLVTASALAASLEHDNRWHAIGTEVGSIADGLYTQLGFDELVRTRLFTKKK